MKINVVNNQQTGYVPDITEKNFGRIITVFFAPLKNYETRRFRCVGCGNILFEYESEIGLIVDSSLGPVDSLPLTVKCKVCKLKCRAMVL